MKIKIISNDRASILMLCIMVVAMLVSFGGAFMLLSLGEARVVERGRINTIAFNIAEAGLEQAMYAVRADFLNDRSWSTVTVGSTYTPSTANWTDIYSGVSLNGGTYTSSIKATEQPQELWLQSTGTYSGQTQTIRTYVKMVSSSPWDNAIFTGSGFMGAAVNGNVNIRGSVVILGTGLKSTDHAIDLGGTAELVGNNYNTLPDSILPKIPALPTIVFGNETISTLNATLRVKRGKVALSGSSAVGEANVIGNSVKETVDGVYVTDGFAGNQGSANVHSDNGWSNAFDLSNVVFPTLGCGATYCDGYYTSSTGYNSDAVIINGNVNITPTTTIAPVTSGSNSFRVDNGNITIVGKVYIKGTLSMNKSGPNKTVTYSGNGSILTSGTVQINADLLTNGDNSYPTNVMAIMTPASVFFNEANINVMGLFYGGTNIIVQKQTNIIGTLVSNWVSVGQNVPSVYQVPDTANHLPAGLIGADSGWSLRVVSWQKM